VLIVSLSGAESCTQCSGSEKKRDEEGLEFHPSDLVVAGAAWNPPVCCTLERGGFLFMSKDAE